MHLPCNKHMIHAPSTPNSFNQYSTIQLTNYTQETNASRVTTFILVTLSSVQGHYTCSTPVHWYYPHIKTYIQTISITISTLPYLVFLNTSLGINSDLEPYPTSFHSLLPLIPQSIRIAISFNSPNTGIRQSPTPFIFTRLISATFSTC